MLMDSYWIKRSCPENFKEGELDFCAQEFSYATPKVELININDCFVSDKGFVYSRYLFVNDKSLLNPTHYDKYFTITHYLKKVLLRKKRLVDRHKKYLLAFDEWSHGHYHWFCDVLPRLIVVKEKLKDYVLLLPAHSSYIRTVGLESLHILGLEPEGIEFIDGKELLHIQNLDLVSHTCLPGYINDTAVKEVRDLFFTKLDLINKPKGNRKIYISRERARFRKILNEREVQDLLQTFNYETVYLEDLSLIAQIKLMSDAASVVSIHGAGLTNVIFLSPRNSVLEFRRDKIYHNQCYWHLSSALQHKYYYLFGKPDNEDLAIEGEGCNITIDINKLKAVLKQMEKNNS